MVQTYTVYAQINSLEEFGFIAGTSFTLNYNIYESNGTVPLDMGGGSFKIRLSPYGQTYAILEKEGTITGIGTAEVVLDSVDTAQLSGKYIQQPIITSFSGESYIPGQGVILIIPAISAP